MFELEPSLLDSFFNPHNTVTGCCYQSFYVDYCQHLWLQFCFRKPCFL